MELLSIFHVGCCGLHTLYGSFQTGAVATNWLLDRVPHCMWKLLKDLSARKDTCITVTCSEDFPLSFCKTCWVEDEKMVAKAVKFWSNIVPVIKHYEGLVHQNAQDNKSYYTLAKHADN